MRRNVRLYPWFRFLRSLLFWQAVWFLYLQGTLSAAEAIFLYAVFDVATTALEVPSGWLSDRWGRRPTLVMSAAAGLASAVMQALGGDIGWFMAAQVLLGVHMAFASGTDSSLLYESLAAEGQADRMEVEELRGWRAEFSALALSALAGGAMARWDLTWPYWASALSLTSLLLITLALREPPRAEGASTGTGLAALKDAAGVPVLRWLFVIWTAMYVLSHVPFVFGQPFIERALSGSALESETPLVSGAITAAMMGLSLVVSLFAPRLRAHVGLTAMVLSAFALQIALPAALAIAVGPVAVLLLLGRMVPDALAQPFIVARMQRDLTDGARATFLSLRSLVARLSFAATLWLAAVFVTDVGQMSEADLRRVLAAYAVGGAVLLAGLILVARRLPRS